MRKFFFVCACGCGTKSDDIEKDKYIRLKQGEKWLAEGCKLENSLEVRKFLGGAVVRPSDF